MKASDELHEYAILDEFGDPIVVEYSVLCREWEGMDRTIAKTQLGGILVSTVFLGINHNFSFEIYDDTLTEPLWYETMIFGGDHDQEQWRYGTLEAAMRGHEYAVRQVNQSMRPSGAIGSASDSGSEG